MRSCAAANAVLSGEEMRAVIGAAPHERTDARTNQRTGGQRRTLSTPAGDVRLRIPKVKVGEVQSGDRPGAPDPDGTARRKTIAQRHTRVPRVR